MCLCVCVCVCVCIREVNTRKRNILRPVDAITLMVIKKEGESNGNSCFRSFFFLIQLLSLGPCTVELELELAFVHTHTHTHIECTMCKEVTVSEFSPFFSVCVCDRCQLRKLTQETRQALSLFLFLSFSLSRFYPKWH